MPVRNPPPKHFQSMTIADGIYWHAHRTPGRVALVEGERQVSFGDLAKRVNRIANAASGIGLIPGDRAAIISANRIEFMEVVAGLSQAGVAVATLNPRQTPAELSAILADCGARLVIADDTARERLTESDLPAVERIVPFGPAYEDWLAVASDRRPEFQPDEWDAFSIPYTSGTTGKPKGVVLAHRSRTLSFLAFYHEYGCYGTEDRFLCVSPLFHGGGFGLAYASVFMGGTCEILARFDPEQVLRRLHAGRHTGTFLVPTHFHKMFELEQCVLEETRETSLQALICNAAPLPDATKHQVIAHFGDGLLNETYGSTEAGVVTNLRPADQLRKTNCVGLPIVGAEVRLLDEEGQQVETGEVGELYSRTATIFNGYWGREAETEAGFRGDWFSAGDMAVRDEEGYLYIVDRKKDMIISGGVNVYPREIEEVLFHHPAVREAAVIGLPDATWGERVKAYVVLHEGADVPGDEDILDFCRERLASHKTPKEVAFIAELPRNASGKMLKKDLRALG